MVPVGKQIMHPKRRRVARWRRRRSRRVRIRETIDTSGTEARRSARGRPGRASATLEGDLPARPGHAGSLLEDRQCLACVG